MNVLLIGFETVTDKLKVPVLLNCITKLLVVDVFSSTVCDEDPAGLYIFHSYNDHLRYYESSESCTSA